MWFKNIQIFSFAEPFNLSASQFQTLLEGQRARPCGKLEASHYGWTSPWGMDNERLVEAEGGRFLLAARREEKLLPPAVVREQVNQQVTAIEATENRIVSAKEKRALYDQLWVQLLPQAFSKSQITYAYIDLEKQWLVIDSANPTRGEDLTVLLRESLGSLKFKELKPEVAPSFIFTEWLGGVGLPSDFTLEEYCELQDPRSAQTVIKCMNQNLLAEEIAGHLTVGKRVIKLALTWQDRLHFILDEHLNIRRIRFLDLIQDQLQDSSPETKEDKKRAEFLICSAEFSAFIPRLGEVFGMAY